jgi:hypothetical protein
MAPPPPLAGSRMFTISTVLRARLSALGVKHMLVVQFK